jgi:hypothetical protein
MRSCNPLRKLSLVAGVIAGLLVACNPPPPEGEVGTIVFDVGEVPPEITSVIGRVAGDSVVLTATNTDSAGLGARGSIQVEPNTWIVTVDAYSNSTLWYTGKDTVTVAANDTAFATVPLACVHDDCLGSQGASIGIVTFFPRGESEPNNSIAECDTTSWSRDFNRATPGVVPAPYLYGGSGRISSDSDVDFWCAFIDFSTTDTLHAFTITEAGSGLDPVLTLFGPDGSALATNDNGGGDNPADAVLGWRIAVGGRYYLGVSAASAPTAPGRYSVFMYVGWPGTLP